MRTLDEQSYEKLLDAAFRFQLALVSNPRISSDDFGKTQKEAKEIFADIEGSLRPWLGRSREDRKKLESQTFREQWKEVAGFDPSDKEAVAKWAEELSKLTQAKAESRMAAEQEEQKRQDSFHRKVEEIRLKRLSQQGRKR